MVQFVRTARLVAVEFMDALAYNCVLVPKITYPAKNAGCADQHGHEFTGHFRNVGLWGLPGAKVGTWSMYLFPLHLPEPAPVDPLKPSLPQAAPSVLEHLVDAVRQMREVSDSVHVPTLDLYATQEHIGLMNHVAVFAEKYGLKTTIYISPKRRIAQWDPM